MRFVLASVAVLATSHAWGYTQEQENVLNHVSEAMVIAERCDNLVVNFELAAMAGILFDLRMEDERTQQELSRRVPEKFLAISRHEDAVICAVGNMLYGAEGANVKNLLVEQ